jgi:hypothetical protein
LIINGQAKFSGFASISVLLTLLGDTLTVVGTSTETVLNGGNGEDTYTFVADSSSGYDDFGGHITVSWIPEFLF